MKYTAPVLALLLIPLAVQCNSRLPVEVPGVDIPGITAPRASDEEQIVALLDEIHQGMESRRIFRVLAHVSRTYSDGEGRTYGDMQNYLNDLFKRYKVIRITRVRPIVEVHDTQARAVETFGTLAEPFNVADDPPINLQGRVDVYLEKISGKWQIVEWGRVY
ncbi:MAG: hypothetical protein AMXMBFR84_08350 [Candidatus Hydrogenedentota bacterium]